MDGCRRHNLRSGLPAAGHPQHAALDLGASQAGLLGLNDAGGRHAEPSDGSRDGVAARGAYILGSGSQPLITAAGWPPAATWSW